uniref:RRM domain-containing protein n=1 Tax=Zea mays TaxID=4577 RepID=A0A804LKX3_MAIZE
MGLHRACAKPSVAFAGGIVQRAPLNCSPELLAVAGIALHRGQNRPRSNTGVITFVNHLEDLAALKTYICQRITTLSKQFRGFGFVEYVDLEDASNAKHYMDGQIVLGRKLRVVYAQDVRKSPSAMRLRAIERSGGGPSCVRRSRSRSPGYHDSPRGRSRSRSRSYSAAQHYSRSSSPRPRERSSPADSGSKSASPGASRSPPRQRSPSDGE